METLICSSCLCLYTLFGVYTQLKLLNLTKAAGSGYGGAGVLAGTTHLKLHYNYVHREIKREDG